MEPAPAAPASEDYPGARLGMPPAGRGSVAGVGIRLGALVLDLAVSWLAGSGIASLIGIRRAACPLPAPGQSPICPAAARSLFDQSVVLTLTFVALQIILLATAGRTVGMRITHLQVVRLDGRVVGLAAVPRTVLLVLAVPALLADRDQRGLHDRACNTVVVRTR
ncbi:MAG: RDD family protein [Mycobacteriales bacterium]